MNRAIPAVGMLLMASCSLGAEQSDARIRELLAELTSLERHLPVVIEYDTCPEKLLSKSHRILVAIPLELGYRLNAAQADVTSGGGSVRISLPAMQVRVVAAPQSFQANRNDELNLNAADERPFVALLGEHTAALGNYYTADGGEAGVNRAAADALATALSRKLSAQGDKRNVDLVPSAAARTSPPDVQVCADSAVRAKFPEKLAPEQFLARGAEPLDDAVESEAIKLREYLKNAAGKLIAYRELDATMSTPVGAYKVRQAPSGRADPDGSDGERVINGTLVEEGTMPWSAAFMRTRDGKREAYCGGTVITRNWVLTAAHCQIRDGSDVIIGRTDLKKANGSVRRVKKVWRHIDFGKAARYDSDIALVQLNSAVSARAATLAKMAPHENEPVIVAGWGATVEDGSTVQYLNSVDLQIEPQDTCVIKYRTTQAPVTDNMFCASKYLPIPKDACQGDSGGGSFAVRDDESLELAGIVSFGKGCATPGFPGVYTKLAPFQGWLKEVQKATGVN